MFYRVRIYIPKKKHFVFYITALYIKVNMVLLRKEMQQKHI